jgi:hypothetical protein
MDLLWIFCTDHRFTNAQESSVPVLIFVAFRSDRRVVANNHPCDGVNHNNDSRNTPKYSEHLGVLC